MPEIMFFPFYGPGRRSDRRVVELRLNFAGQDDFGFPKQSSDIRKLLLEANILTENEEFPIQACSDEPMQWYSSLLVQTALLLQQKTGHCVDYTSVSCDLEQQRCVALMEHENSEVGMTAARFAVEIFSGRLRNLTKPFQQFSVFARERALMAETIAIIEACRNSGIPCLQLDREPLSGKLNTGTRIRQNGLLSLGHGTNNLIVDGTFCISRSAGYLKSLLKNDEQRKTELRQLRLPVAPSDLDLTNRDDLFQLLSINGKTTVVQKNINGQRRLVKDTHDSVIQKVNSIAEKMDCQPVVVTIQTSDISQPLSQSGGVVVDFELAPELGEILGNWKEEPEILNSVATDLVDWLFPEPASARIPVLTVTGTNGKTTTSRMIHHILQTSAYKTGLVCSDGIFLDGQQVSKGDASAFVGHARALASNQIDAAVLETHHRGIAVRGFAFQHCNIAVCLNVTRDHLKEGEIETLEEMTVIKRALLERASDAVVLNADSPECMSMLPLPDASRVCLFSSCQGNNELEEINSQGSIQCLVEEHQNESWVVIKDGVNRHATLSVASMPCTFAGAARFNLENAQAAISACYLAGVSLDSIRTAMRSFSMDYANTPGRLNYYENLPFTAVVDYAHNPDGIARLSEFASSLPVKGRRLLMIAGPGDRSDEGIGDMARAAAGKFDHYVCRHYNNTRGRQTHEVPEILKAALLKAGVEEQAISMQLDSAAAIDDTLNLAGPSDLVVLTVDHKEFEPTNTRLLAVQKEQIDD